MFFAERWELFKNLRFRNDDDDDDYTTLSWLAANVKATSAGTKPKPKLHEHNQTHTESPCIHLLTDESVSHPYQYS